MVRSSSSAVSLLSRPSDGRADLRWTVDGCAAGTGSIIPRRSNSKLQVSFERSSWVKVVLVVIAAG